MISKVYQYRKLVILLFLPVVFIGCVTAIPKEVLKLSPQSLEKRKLQTRQFDTQNEEQIISACAGVLQDLGFTLDESETELGLIAASKDRDAKDTGQRTLAFFLEFLAALGGSSSDAMERCDNVQKIRSSVVTRKSLDNSKILVRVTFQRMIWDVAGRLSRVETLDEPELYQGFFEKLSKAIFLEAHSI